MVAPYVMTVVPEPGRTLDEFARVLKPGGEIVLVNHVGAETGLRAAAEALARPGAAPAWAGGRNFPGRVIGDWIDGARPACALVERRALRPGLPVHPRAPPPARHAGNDGKPQRTQRCPRNLDTCFRRVLYPSRLARLLRVPPDAGAE